MRTAKRTRMSSPEPISIVMRSKNDAALIRATLRAVHAQDYPAGFELIHIDSGSTDGTLDIIRSFQPAQLIEIKPEDYVPGTVLNRGMRAARSRWVVFLNSDCEPVDTHWLAQLVRLAQSDAKCGTAFGRQIPRRDCQAVYAHDYDRCFSHERESGNWDHFFSMANSIVRRDVWEAEPFREDLQYSEDDEWSRRLIAKGWSVLYAPESAVFHSHNYTLRQAFRRAYGEAFALAAIESVPADRYSLLRTVAAGGLREWLRDFGYCRRSRRLAEWPHALGVRIAQRLGKVRGFRSGWARYQGGKTAMGAC